MAAACLWLLVSAGSAEAVEFQYPIYLAIGPDGTIFVSDQDVPAIVRIAPDRQSSVLFQGSRQYRTPLYRPRGLAVDAQGHVWACDPATMDVYRVGPDGTATPTTGKKIALLDKRETTMGDIVQPEGIVLAPDGTVYVSDLRLHLIYRMGADKKLVELAKVPAPRGMALDKDGTLVVVSHSPNQLVRVDPKTGEVKPIVSARPFRFPLSVCVLPDGNYLVTDNYAKAIWKVTPEGKAEKWIEGEPLINPTGIATDGNGKIVIADPHAKKIFVVADDRKLEVLAP